MTDNKKFELCKIDPHNCTIEELKAEIQRLSDIKDEYDGLQHSIKIFINSIYGACASIYFTGYNVFVAEAVTLQGQDLIHFANDILDDYFLNKWHLDTELHKILGLTRVNKVLTPRNTVVVYNDTDSTYMTFQPILDSCDWKGDPKEFILLIKEHKLDPYFDKKFGEYAKKFNTENIQNFELEKIAYSGLMMAKKKYVLDTAWKEPGIDYKPQEKLSFTGVEIVQRSTPKFARKVLKELMLYIFKQGKSLNYAEAVKKLKDIKAQFVMQDPDDISKSVSIGDYEKYVLEDRREIVLADKCPINVRSASVFNHILFNSRYKSKYNLIRTGDKIKHYYAKGEHQAFGFLPGNYPYEFAPEIDYDRQFEKIIIEPFNRFIEVLGFNPIPGNLFYARSFFYKMTVKQILENITPEVQKEMEQIWFTADIHHGHPKIVPICNRPVYFSKETAEYYNQLETENPDYNAWKDPGWKADMSEIHDKWIVKEVFNKYVGKKHAVYILGDLSQAKRKDAEKFIDRLNGNKFLIEGNHDKNIKNSTRFSQVTQIKDFTFSRPGINIHIALCHYPMASWNRKPHGAWHLYGHVHGRYKNAGLSLDVGIDNPEIGWKPINLYEITLIMRKKEIEMGEGKYYDNGIDGVD